MFGLTKREQRWKAEKQAAELMVGLAQTSVRAAADVRIAEAQSDAELERLRKENAELRAALAASDGYRNCEFCGCHTNAKVRACCDKGRAASGVMASDGSKPE